MSSFSDAQSNVGLMYEYTAVNAIIHRPAGTINFSFIANGAAIQDPGASNPTAASAAEMAAFRAAFQLWQDVANVNFVEVADGTPSASIIRIGNADLSTPGNSAENYHTFDINSGVSTYGEILVDHSRSGGSFAIGTFANKIAVHEIGHSLSLIDTSNVAGFPGTYENTRYTVMSYAETFGPATYPSTPMLWDIYAVQQQYGVNTSTRTGNTTYGFNSNAGRDAFDFTVNTQPFVTVYDSGGFDRLDVSGFSQAATVDLHDGEYSSVGGLTQNVAIAFGTIIEAATGGSGNDTLVGNAIGNSLIGGLGNDTLLGNAGNDTLAGGDGNDFLTSGAGADSLNGGNDNDYFFLGSSTANDTADGGAGSDTVLYVNEASMVTINLNGQVANGASIGSDQLLNIEGATGGNGNDVIVGTPGANHLSGSNGNDLLVGDAGNDTLQGDAGMDSLFGAGDDDQLSGGSENDQLNGGAGSDTLSGDTGNDTLFASAGSDSIDGGSGFDWYDLSLATGNASVVLGLQTASGPGIGVDTLISIENVRGGSGNDSIIGDIGINILDGGGGNDTVRAGPASDVLIGGSGFDFVSFLLTTQSVTADLMAQSASSSQTGNDSVSGFEGLIGGTVGDTLAGDDAANDLEGRNGNDRLVGRGGDDTLDGGVGRDAIFGGGRNDLLLGDRGHDRLQGGGGDDFLSGGAADDTLRGGPGIDTADFSGASGGVDADLVRADASGKGVGTDLLFGIENLTGGNFADRLAGDGAANSIETGAGADTLIGRGGNDSLTAGNSADVIVAGRGADYVEAGPGADTVNGSAGRDTLLGEQGRDLLRGQGGNDRLLGAAFSDTLKGGAGRDLLKGGAGKDILTGGSGNDRFDFDRLSASKPGAQRDHITDFNPGEDTIDFSGIDAVKGLSGNDDFHFIDMNGFSGTAGELRYFFKGSATIVTGDVNGDAKGDFSVALDGAQLALQASDFFGVV